MAGEYGFSYYKRQFLWVSSSSDNKSGFSSGPLKLATFNAQPRSLLELRSHWASEAALSKNHLRFVCTWFKDGNGECNTKNEWNLDCEQDFHKALELVNCGETVMLTVITQKDTLADEEVAGVNTKSLPPWFADYMKKFRSEMVAEIGQMIDEKLTLRHGRHHHHHHNKHGDHARHETGPHELHKGALGMVDIKCMKLEKKLQKLQSRSQKMSLELDEAAGPSTYKHKGERKLGKMTRKMEQLEARRSKIIAKKTLRMPMESREQLDASAPVYEEPKYENVPLSPPESIRPSSKYDAIVLLEGETSIVNKLEEGNIYSALWVVKNVGEMAWNEKTILRLAHASTGITVNEQTISAPALQPGCQTSISIFFQVPLHPGLFECYFHFYQEDERFGQALRCSFTVNPIPGETHTEITSLCSNTITQHPFIKEIREADLTGSITKDRDQEEYESGHDDDDEEVDDDDTSSDSDDSDSFVHIPMPQCYQYKLDEDPKEVADEGGASNVVSLDTSVIANELQAPGNQPCKTPPTTPKNSESDADIDGEPTSDTTQINVTQRANERETSSSPVQILPDNLVTGAMNVAAKAFSSAEAIMRSLQNSASPAHSVVTSNVSPTVEAPKPIVAEPTAVAEDESMTDPRTRNLITLAEMGFLNDRLNETLLDTYKENMQEVIASLLTRQGGSSR
ncbi:Hypothetical predicted protein [Cloeon dipterum]|uniref:Nbr1 FW domain-containing protein n=1 Tax=Cloeon dipterum TaxID=197152 RepID=A0A8S1BNX7_9INSE|nr:Hypothetical predicted protein [Cloeon dipterum]